MRGYLLYIIIYIHHEQYGSRNQSGGGLHHRGKLVGKYVGQGDKNLKIALTRGLQIIKVNMSNGKSKSYKFLL